MQKRRRNKNRSYNNFQNEYLKIFLVGLSGSFTEREIFKFFKDKYPSVFKVTLPKNNGKGSGCGVLMLRNENEYDEILNKYLFHYNNRRFFANPFMKDDELDSYLEKIDKRRVFLNKIPKDLSNEELAKVMEQFGDLDDAYKIEDKDPMKKYCIGFLMYKKEESATKAINEGTVFISDIDYILIRPFSRNKQNRDKKRRAREGMDQEEDEDEDEYDDPRFLNVGGKRRNNKNAQEEEKGDSKNVEKQDDEDEIIKRNIIHRQNRKKMIYDIIQDDIDSEVELSMMNKILNVSTKVDILNIHIPIYLRFNWAHNIKRTMRRRVRRKVNIKITPTDQNKNSKKMIKRQQTETQ